MLRNGTLLLLTFIYYACGYQAHLTCQKATLHLPRKKFINGVHLSRQNTYRLLSTVENENEPFGTGSRLLLSGIATVGAAETAFLTYSKLSATSLGNFCNSPESCSNVLNGPYSTVPFFNVPLSAVAFIGYALIAILSVAPLVNRHTDTPENRSVILFASSGMAAFSIYLMVLLATVIQTPCNFCYLSATLSFSMAAIALTKKTVQNPTKSLVISASSAAMSFIASTFIFYTTSALVERSALADSKVIPHEAAVIVASDAAVVDKKPPQEAPKIKNSSSPRAMLIGNRLHALNAKMYGAFWCSHCNNQKQELGIEASKLFEYVECAKDGLNSQYGLCKSEKIPGFPTWQINGQLYPGEKDLSEMEKLLNDVEKSILTVKN
jgi:uncharacterized membrane protein